jgi:hypothetical protein
MGRQNKSRIREDGSGIKVGSGRRKRDSGRGKFELEGKS